MVNTTAGTAACTAATAANTTTTNATSTRTCAPAVDIMAVIPTLAMVLNNPTKQSCLHLTDHRPNGLDLFLSNTKL